MQSSRTRALLLVAVAAPLGTLGFSLLVQLPRPADAFGQDRNPPSIGKAADEQAIRKAAAAHVEAMNKGDLAALIAFWTPDADYVDETGKTTRGKDALAALFKKGLIENKGKKVSGKTNSIKFLRPDVALEDGTLEFASSDGSKEANRYAVVWVKTGDRWLISSARDLPEEVTDVPSLAYPQLKNLEWLVGEWQDASDKIDVNVVCRWDRNKSFLLMQYEVKHPGEDPIQVTQRIGWDARNGMIRSWTFDSLGGFGESYWRREGNRWVAATSGILPDGGRGGATNVYDFVDPNTFVWRSLDRDVDGQPLANAEIKFVRKTAK
jgi:uncharacterized protein (TIGR02246 family)